MYLKINLKRSLQNIFYGLWFYFFIKSNHELLTNEMSLNRKLLSDNEISNLVPSDFQSLYYPH